MDPEVKTVDLHNAEQIQEMILKAGFKMDGYAQSYFNAMKRAESEAHLYGSSPEEGLKTQVLYFFSNAKARTPEQKEIKKKLLAWAGYKGYRAR